MAEQTYRQLIVQGIQGLPSDVLTEIADFYLFPEQTGVSATGL